MLIIQSEEDLRALLLPMLQEALSGAATKSDTPEKILTCDDVCRELQISKTTLCDWRKKGIVPFMQLGKLVRYKLSDIIEAGHAHSKYQRR